MNEHEKRVKEQRTVEANKKNFMGFDGKIGCIVRYMGQPLIAQTEGGTYFNSTPGYDFWKLPNEQEEFGAIEGGTPEEICQQIPTWDMEGVEQPEGGIWMERQTPIPENLEMLGWHFDGLSRGMHLEITYLEENKELLVRYKGRIIYREIAGDLEYYVPSSDWESMIEQLFRVARRLQVKDAQQEREQKKKHIQQQKESWLQRMKNKWGF